MDPIMLEWAYAREVMRCLGFLPDELFFAIHNPEEVILNGELIKVNETVVSLILRAQNKSFTWTIGTTKLSTTDARAAYEELCSNWNEGEGWSLEGFRASEAYQQKIALISALQDKGFHLNPRAS
jgi:hypothetical protein